MLMKLLQGQIPVWHFGLKKKFCVLVVREKVCSSSGVANSFGSRAVMKIDLFSAGQLRICKAKIKVSFFLNQAKLKINMFIDESGVSKHRFPQK